MSKKERVAGMYKMAKVLLLRGKNIFKFFSQGGRLAGNYFGH